MTSMAFSLGVLPLVPVIRRRLGRAECHRFGVLGGTLSATILGVVFVPLFFMIVTRLFRRGRKQFE